MAENEIIEKLILEGAMEFAGVDIDSGEMLYNFTPKLKEIMPELYKEHLNHVNGEIMKLWEKGFVDVSITDDSPQVKLTTKAFDDESLNTLSKADRWSLEEMKRLMRIQEL